MDRSSRVKSVWGCVATVFWLCLWHGGGVRLGLGGIAREEQARLWTKGEGVTVCEWGSGADFHDQARTRDERGRRESDRWVAIARGAVAGWVRVGRSRRGRGACRRGVIYQQWGEQWFTQIRAGRFGAWTHGPLRKNDAARGINWRSPER